MRRIRELINRAQLVHPNDHFFDRFEEECRQEPAKARAYRTYESALRWLDCDSWGILKAKAIAHFTDHRPGQLKQGFFNQLNESFAYRHLVRQGCKHVQMLPERGKRTPDIQYFDKHQLRHCEVKTIGISDDEIARRGSRKGFSNVYARLGERFFNKLHGTLVVARSQIEAQGTAGLVYVVVNCDDYALDNYSTYCREVAAFARTEGVDDVYLKFGLRFNRHMHWASHRS